MTNFLNIPEGIPEYRWYYCIMKDIIRDCQHILSVLALSKCRETCCHMNATADIEYLCSCHPKTMKCCAIDYNYHNINLNTLRLVNLHSCFASNSNPSSEVQHEMSFILRRLYRLYLHGYYQHFDVYQQEEVCYDDRMDIR
ncbi:mob-like protein phocein [Blastocystis sp. subtype 4]|uniref:mob-like protein phocein n=1 Tax=Blastocystis sp. subtype 4 TaxID=944170 RepID=UPI000711FA5B|nr:mob-like protein phocein [Blastocystis sp. subtype 4]KNB45651.1 mob-like protein phocein [Blastocystis sp. subtype 4]|eukprot:XP_014529094.1 mob-like protein phocein [Blastocystis sp. subtype 4]